MVWQLVLKSFSVQEVKASFTASALNYGTAVVDNSLKAEGLSQTSASTIAVDGALALNGALASAASSGFASSSAYYDYQVPGMIQAPSSF